MKKFIIYIALFFSTYFVSAQAEADSIVPSEISYKEIIYKDTLTYAKREFRSDFKENYQGPEFQYKPKSRVKTKWDEFLGWLNDKINWIFARGDGEKASSAVNLIVRILAILVLIFVVYMIVRAILNKEGIWIFGRGHKKIAVGDLAGEDIHALDFNQMVSDTKTTGDYRLTLRYYYLWLLKKLSNRSIIDWHRDKTNADYLYEIKDPQLRKEFEYLSYVYDYSWYGEFPIDANAFEKAEKAFLKTLNAL